MGALKQMFLAGGVAGFSPMDIGGLDLWLRASSITGLNDGDPVDTWTNEGVLSGNDMASSGTSRPLWIANQITGYPIVRFDGVNDSMQLGSNVAIRAAHTIAFVVKSASLTQNSYFLNLDAPNTKAVLSGFTDNEWWWFLTTKIGDISTSVFKVISTQIGDSTSNRWYIGGVGAVSPWAGDLAELVIYDSVISGPNLALVLGYLSAKYGGI